MFLVRNVQKQNDGIVSIMQRSKKKKEQELHIYPYLKCIGMYFTVFYLIFCVYDIRSAYPFAEFLERKKNLVGPVFSLFLIFMCSTGKELNGTVPYTYFIYLFFCICGVRKIPSLLSCEKCLSTYMFLRCRMSEGRTAEECTIYIC